MNPKGIIKPMTLIIKRGSIPWMFPVARQSLSNREPDLLNRKRRLAQKHRKPNEGSPDDAGRPSADGAAESIDNPSTTRLNPSIRHGRISGSQARLWPLAKRVGEGRSTRFAPGHTDLNVRQSLNEFEESSESPLRGRGRNRPIIDRSFILIV